MTPRERLRTTRLYLVCPARSREWIAAAVRGGVDLIQLRDKSLDDDAIVEAARAFRGHDALFILNDRPDLVDACGADGVHVGQDDDTPAAARALVGPDRIVGRSTHAPDQAAAADADPDVDYLAVGPVHATPTKPGRPAAGLHYVAHAASSVGKPWFAIGGLDAGNVHEVVEQGATRIVVVRAITEAEDPEAAARALRDALEGRVSAPDDMARGYARSRERADAIRSELQPLGPDERPLGLKLGVALTLVLAAANLVGALAGSGGPPSLAFAYALGLSALAVGLWQRRYLAILAFQALLALTIIVSTLSLAFASTALAAALCVVAIAVSAPIFWLLVRVMARLQVPQR